MLMVKQKKGFDRYKPTNVEARRKECARITDLMSSKRPFSFLRLGDMELPFLIAYQKQHAVSWHQLVEETREMVSSTVAFGDPGLSPQYAPRLQAAYERCSYLDFHEGNPGVRQELPNWKHNRPPTGYRNPSQEVSELSLDWLKYEFFRYVRGRRCLFVGAEAGILKELSKDKVYGQIANNYWPPDIEAIFIETGRIDDQLDRIKSDIAEVIDGEKIDTAFISLGGGAKILCYELAKEHGIAAFDFGGLMRGLTYSGSDGYGFVRSTHYPYYFRVPFETYMDALERAMPGLSPDKLVAKAHAQLALELIRKEEGWSWPSEWRGEDCLDWGRSNRRNFWRSYSTYCARYKLLGESDKRAAEQIAEFDRWRKYSGLGLDGKIVRLTLRGKIAARGALESIRGLF
jgi:hypothetical protein